MTWTIVHNPGAGRAVDVGPRLRTALEAHNVSYEVLVSDHEGHVAELVGEAVGKGSRRFAAVGGDGTAHLVLNALMQHTWDEPPRLAIIPAGSGSDFIRTFALPRDLEGGVALLASDTVYRCDIGLVEGEFGSRYFLNAVNFGVAAASAGRAARLPGFLGGLRYTAAFWLELVPFRPGAVAVSLGRRRMEADGLNVVLANGQFFGGGLNVAPQASVMDGMLDVQVFAGPKRRAFTLMPRVIKGLHLKHPAVQRGRAAEIDVEVPPGWPIEADGEMVGTGSAHVSVVPGAIDFQI